jgi:signal transduction histidine kinase
LLEKTDSVYLLGENSYFLKDDSGVVTLKNIRVDPRSHSFTPVEKLNFGTSRSAIWNTFKLVNHTTQPFYLVIDRPLLQHITLYSIKPDGSIDSASFGALYPVRDRSVQSIFYAHRLLEPHSDEPLTFYVQFKGDQALDLQVRVMTAESIIKEQQKRILLFGLVAGFLLAMLIYNLFVYFSIRAKQYLFYIIHLALLIFNTDLSFFGVGFYYLWPDIPEINQYLNAFVTLTFITLMLLMSSLLSTAKKVPVLHNWTYLLYGAHAINLILFATGNFFVANLAVEAVGMITSVYLVIVGIVCWRQGVSGAKFYVIGWSVAFFCIVAFALYLSGFLPSNTFTANAPLFGNCFEVTLFSFALTERIRKLRQEKDKIQLEKIGLMLSQNEMLERLVKERTDEIAAQNEEIISQNEELENRNETIGKQNETLKVYNLNLRAEVEISHEGLLDSNRELVEKNNQLEQFAFMAAHNLRSPVARIKGLGNLLNMLDANDPERKFIIERIVESTVSLDQALHDLNTILELKKGLARFEPVSLKVSLDKVMDTLKSEINLVQAEIHFDIEESSLLNSVPQYIESIFYNLIGNAIKYKSDERSLVIQVRSAKIDNKIKIEVQDNGLGLDLELHRNKIFRIYQRFHSHVEGRGMGLHIVKIQVEAINGTVEIFSKLNEGTTFEIMLPIN